MRLILVTALIVAGLASLTLMLDTAGIAAWAAGQQRAFQTEMAQAVRALQTGAPGGWTALLGAAGAYGFVHALGPGHGKYLIGGVGLGTSVPTMRLVALALASGLAQALWAIALVYGCFFFLDLTARRMTALAEDVLAPASYLAIGAVGLVLVWRGVRAMSRRGGAARHDDHAHAHGDCEYHAHGPTPEEAAQVTSLREAAILVGSIAIRPCTGAIFLLVIAWQMDILAAGAAAVVVMGLGTATLTGLVAVSSIAARGVTWATADRAGAMAVTLPVLQTLAGIVILWISLLLLGVGAF